ncbi:MAG: TolC family protein [Vicinamibacterales bacterium]|nr:TolC family protein [Vicinamibacterales bacterium]
MNLHLPWGLLIALCLVAGQAEAQSVPVSPPSSLTLAQAVEAARAHSGARAAAAARTDGALQAASTAGRWPNPSVELRSENWGSGAPGGLPADAFVVLTQPLELGGKRAARRGLADRAADEARAAETGVGASADLAVIRRFVEAVTARDQARALAGQAQEVAELVRILARRVDAGTVPEADLRTLEVEHTRIDLDRMTAELRGLRALADLSAWLGPDAPASLEALVAPPAPAPPAEAVAPHVLDHRPDIQAARARVAAADQAVRLERARAIPDLHLSGGVKRTSGYETGVVALTMPLPLFDRNRAAIAVSDGLARAAALDLAFAERLATAEIAATRLAADRLASEARTIRTRLVAPARLARDAGRAAFREGTGNLLRLVDAERTYAEVELVALDLWHDAVLAAVDLRRALGEDLLP